MHLHLNRPAKRAGEAGKALRASGKVFIYFRGLSGSLRLTGSRECRWVVYTVRGREGLLRQSGDG